MYQIIVRKNPSNFRKKPQILIGLRILFQSPSAAKLLHFSETVNPSSDVNRNADVGMNAIGHYQEKNALFREEDFAFINSLRNMTQKESENSSGTKLCSGNQRKDHFRLESVKWRAASRKCHHIKRFRQMKEKRLWWSPSKPLQATNKSKPTGKKTITAQKVVAISGLQQKN